MADIDGRVIVTGGWDLVCPPGADCVGDDVTRFVDGAIYDSGTDRWTPIADAPVPIVGGTSTTSGTDLYIPAACVGEPACPSGFGVLRYRSDEDDWDILPTPDQLESPMLTSLTDGTVIAFNGSDERGESPDYRLVDDSRWEPLPDDPLPAVYDRFILGNGERLFVFGSPGDGNGAEKVGAVFDRASDVWTELAEANGSGYQVWDGNGSFYLNPHFGSNVRGGVYDPATDTWNDLPTPPDAESWRNDMAGILRDDDATYEYPSGWVFDTTTDEWIEIPPRPGEPTEGGVVTNSGRNLVVYGGQDLSSREGTLLADAWIWTPEQATNPSDRVTVPASNGGRSQPT